VVSLERLFGAESSVLEDRDYRLLLAATAFPILGSALVSPVLDAVIGPFGTTPARIGLMISVMTAPAIVLIPIAGVIADRYGRRPVLVASLLLFGAGGSAIALTTDFRLVLGLRFVQGVGFSGIVPIITTSIGDLYDGAREATAQGLRMSLNGLSGAFFPLLAGVLVGLAWQLPFLLYALAIPVAAVVYRWFEEPVEVDGGSPDQGGGEPYRRALARLLARPRVAAIVVARSLPVVVWLGFFTYNSLIVARVFGGSALEAGVLAAAGNFVFAIAGSQAGRLTARLGSRFVPLGLANGCLTAGFAVVLFAPDVRVAVAGIAVAGLGFGLSLTLYRSLLTRMATPALRGGVVSLSAAGGRLTATLTPVAMGAAIAWLEPAVGLTAALRMAGLGAAVVGGGGGLLATAAAWLAPAVAQPSAFAIE
jgi:MFS family permease